MIKKYIKDEVSKMKWLQKVMYGRYGGDQLSRTLLIISFVLIVLVSFLPGYLFGLTFIAYIPTIVSIFRILSKNVYKRQQENYKYIIIKNKLINWIKYRFNEFKDLKTHKYFKCKNCKQKLRVPRRKGKISITCPKCKTTFKAKS